MANQKPQVLKIPMPDPRLTAVESFIFTAITTTAAFFFVSAAFFPQADSLRTTAAIGWFFALLLSAGLRNLYKNAKQMRSYLIAYTQVIKAAGLPLIDASKLK